MKQMNTITHQNASASEELAATAEEMSSQAAQLQELMDFFHMPKSASKAAPPPQSPTLPDKKQRPAGKNAKPHDASRFPVPPGQGGRPTTPQEAGFEPF